MTNHPYDPTVEAGYLDGIPVKGRRRGCGIPKGCVPWQRPATSKDAEYDMPRAEWGTLNDGGFYIARINTKPANNSAGYEKKYTDFNEVAKTEWDKTVQDMSGWLTINGVDIHPRYKGSVAVVEETFDAEPQSPEVLEEAGQEATHPEEPAPEPEPEDQTAAEAEAPAGNHSPLLVVPGKKPWFIPNQEFWSWLDSLWGTMQRRKRPVNGVVSGQKGSGKTEGVEQWCAVHGYLYYRFDCIKVAEILDLLGETTPDTDQNGQPTLTFIESDFMQVIQDPRPKVVCLDELNRMSSTIAANGLLSLLDGGKRLYITLARRHIEVAPSTLLVATVNGPLIGSDSVTYSGTQPLDAALVSRIANGYQLPYPDVQTIQDILRKYEPSLDDGTTYHMGQVANELARQGVWSPDMRELMAAADLLAAGTSLYKALAYTLGRVYYDDGSTECPFVTTFRAVLEGKGIAVDPR